jgi:hypothetical protein
VLLALGDRHYDVGRRAVVLGALLVATLFEEPPSLGELLTRAEHALADGADALSFPAYDGVGSLVTALRLRYDVPLGIASTRVDHLDAAFAAGAHVAILKSHRAELFDAVARAGASVIVVAPHPLSESSERVQPLGSAIARARAAGIPAERIVVDIGVHGPAIADSIRASLDMVPTLLADGHVLAFDTLFLDRQSTAAVTAAALVRGCGLVATTEVRAARRVVDVIATLRATRNQGAP